jgi:hypothetical protein
MITAGLLEETSSMVAIAVRKATPKIYHSMLKNEQVCGMWCALAIELHD